MALSATIEFLVENFREAREAAISGGIAARAVFLDEIFAKNLVLSSSSLFEQRISRGIEEHVLKFGGRSDCIVSLVRIKAIKRQYHTYFDWEDEKLGVFPTLLGDTLGSILKTEAKRTPMMENSAAFLELGSLRNNLVHKNFAVFDCNKTSEELISLCEKAEMFVQRIEVLLN
jgi:hypothetical protein